MNINVHVDIHIHGGRGGEVPQWLSILTDLITRNQEAIMASADETLELAKSNRSRVGSLHALLDGIKAQLADALSGATIPPAVQAKIDAVFAEMKGEAADLDTALNTNVPPPATP